MLPVPAEFRDRPFGLAEAQAQGLTRRALGGARFVRVFRGVYAHADLPLGLREQLLAALLAGPADAVVSHRTALAWYGLELSGGADGRIHLSTRLNAVCREERIRVHRRLHPISSRDLRAIPATSPERTFVDCAAQFTLVQSVAAADWLIAQKLTTAQRLMAYCETRHLDGVVAARRALGHVGPDSRSPMESFVRLLMQLAGLPTPVCNFDVHDAEGIFLACTDFAWPEFKVAVEYDGRWHDEPRQRVRDRDRREYLEAQGWSVVVLVDRDLRVPLDMVRRIHRRLTAHGHTGPAPWLSFDDAAMFAPGAF
ncbi:DUF559 domain-containing protein [Aeromicrobium senzhongii]|uniref:DUF559 domain-containing protein n=1 Tax=Aeromicrobium senzhongii TaxID=2663859 RepID=A0ABX6SXB3_9ACTN|nr:DUF559 domain-containing protein [Aeromicrobium senzhongii]MTB88892.1 DUF559 domain-containing protein [Aeromicrobium senzhongii]QNL93825.1 DUF559 domain-containing protein [Aeromicrobium senzhongii]